jgi:hypothetical protein
MERHSIISSTANKDTPRDNMKRYSKSMIVATYTKLLSLSKTQECSVSSTTENIITEI